MQRPESARAPIDLRQPFDIIRDRLSNRSLARLACEIYAGNGITAWFKSPERDDAVLTTPELSFLIAELEAVGGINLSASHNPPDDSGVKTYDAFGSQPIAPKRLATSANHQSCISA